MWNFKYQKADVTILGCLTHAFYFVSETFQVFGYSDSISVLCYLFLTVLCVVKNTMLQQIAIQLRNGSQSVKMTQRQLIILQQTQKM